MRVNADIENSSVNSKSAFIPLSDRQFACQGELRAHGGRRETGWLKISYSIQPRPFGRASSGGLQFSSEGVMMDQNLINLRQRMIETSNEFLKAQRDYLNASYLYAGKSETELKEAAEEFLRAAEPYDAALQDLRQYLLASEPFEARAEELQHTEQFISALKKEKRVVLELLAHH